jgi:two-component system LytT family response regulator
MASQAKIRTMIVDDEGPARARVRQLLKAESDVEIIAECANARAALDSLQRDQPDLMFLDVQMPRMSGLEMCKAATASSATMPLVVFVTAYDEYALKAFEVHAVDYLLKPFDRGRFQKAMAHVRERLNTTRGPASDPRLANLLEHLRGGLKKTDRLIFKQNGRVIFLRTETIDWIEADGNYVRVQAGNDSHYFRETLSGLEAQLPADKFMRISRSSIVNLDRIKELQPLFYGDYVVILQNGSRLNMSRTFRERLEAMLSKRQ